MPRLRHWVLKATVQKALSMLPGGTKANALLQRYVTRSLELNDNQFELALNQCRKHLQGYFTLAAHKPGFSVFELGTGWYPIIPIGMYLCGARKVWTLDIQSFLSSERNRRALDLFAQYVVRGRLNEILPWVDGSRIRFLLSLAESETTSSVESLLRALEIHPMVGNAAKLEPTVDPIDLFFSNGVLEHIREDVLPQILKNFAGLASPRAVMSHYIYMGDPFLGFDPTITAFNFLKFTRPVWGLIDNSLKPHNRLRLCDYRKLHEENGWIIKGEDNIFGSLEELRKLHIASEFRRYSEQDLLAVRTWLVSSRY